MMLFQGDHLLDDLGEAFGSGGGLANIPLTLNRWTEESRVLDGDAAHDYITGIYRLSFFSQITDNKSYAYNCLRIFGLCINASGLYLSCRLHLISADAQPPHVLVVMFFHF